MARIIKEMMVTEYGSFCADLSTCVVLGYQGISAVENNLLRKKLIEQNIKITVIHNRLAAIALNEAGLANVVGLLGGPSAIVWGGDDPIILAKAVVESQKKYRPLVIRGGFIDGQIVEPDQLKKLANIPSREVLYAQVISGMSAPLSQFVRLLSNLLGSFARLTRSLSEKRET